MVDARILVPVLTGPTASGKTAVALELAKLTPLEIIAADSRTIYRGLDIGTAKPTAAERAAVPHHGIDIIGPGERYSAGRFAKDAAAWIDAVAARDRMPLVVGGTGFYLRALFEGLFEEPELDEETRAALSGVLSAMTDADLVRWATRLDPEFREGGGRQRAARAIEVALLSGKPLSTLHKETPAPRPPCRAFYARLEVPRAELAERIARRTAAMIDAGLMDEVRRQLDAGVPADAPGLTGVGYREAAAVLQGRLKSDALAEAITSSTRQYAKRQDTWFRHQLPSPVLVLDGMRPAAALAQEVLSGYRAAR